MGEFNLEAEAAAAAARTDRGVQENVFRGLPEVQLSSFTPEMAAALRSMDTENPVLENAELQAYVDTLTKAQRDQLQSQASNVDPE
ncbi:MAG: hypothetical protein WCW16_00370 [Candidatus Magasanikbacteria bacterium]